MFGASQIQTRARLNTRKTLGCENDENGKLYDQKAIVGKDGLKTKNAPPGKMATTAKSKPTAIVTRKRAALGDLSNIQTKPPPKIAKAGVTRKDLPAKQSAAADNVPKKDKSGPVKPLVKNPINISKDDVSNRPIAQSRLTRSTTFKNRIPAENVQERETVSKSIEKVEVESASATKNVAVAEPKPIDDDLMLAGEYSVEIFAYMRELEIITKPDPNYMVNQNELKWKTRAVLVDWLISIHSKLRLTAETLYLAINILDRFLSIRNVSLVKVQLVGITALLIASKYEEVIHPSAGNLLYLSDSAFTEEEVYTAERYVLQSLNFSLQYPSPLNFLRRLSQEEGFNYQTRTLAKYLMEITILDHAFLEFPPSQIAGGALLISRKMLRSGEWTADLEKCSTYSLEQVQQVSDLMLEYLCKPIKHEMLFKKYSSKKFLKSSIFVRNWIKRHYGIDHMENANTVDVPLA